MFWFRAPTLNELFRQFRVGNITTLGNDGLAPEQMVSIDAGMDWRLSSWLLRSTVFLQQIDDLIGNATIRVDPTTLRQRQNIGKATSRGVEFEIQKSLRHVRIEAAYLFVDSQLSTNRWMPQTPKHQGSFQILYSSEKTLLSAGLRSYALQFEDDLNSFVLPGFATVQFKAKRKLGKGVSAFLAAENAFDRRFVVGFSPTTIITGPSRTSKSISDRLSTPRSARYASTSGVAINITPMMARSRGPPPETGFVRNVRGFPGSNRRPHSGQRRSGKLRRS